MQSTNTLTFSMLDDQFSALEPDIGSAGFWAGAI